MQCPLKKPWNPLGPGVKQESLHHREHEKELTHSDLEVPKTS